MTPAAEDESAGALPLRAVFFGSGAFALPILEAAQRAPEIDLVAVISTPDRPAGRRAELTPTPIASAARDAGLPLLQPASLREPAAVQRILELRPDVGILADYGRIVPPAILGAFPRGILNVHPSLLPRYRGATPIPAAIVAGDDRFGVTLIELVDRLDAGPIIAAADWAARGDETGPLLEAAAARAGATLLTASLGPWLAGRLLARAQDESQADLTRPLRREDGLLDLGRPAVLLERQVRALGGWPGTYVLIGDVRAVVLEAKVVSGESQAPTTGGGGPAIDVGRVVPVGDGLGVRTPDGILELVRVQPAGGRPMSGAELRRGRPGLLGSAVGS